MTKLIISCCLCVFGTVMAVGLAIISLALIAGKIWGPIL